MINNPLKLHTKDGPLRNKYLPLAVSATEKGLDFWILSQKATNPHSLGILTSPRSVRSETSHSKAVVL